MKPRADSALPAAKAGRANSRVRLWYAVLLFIAAVFIIRLFYLQIIRHDYYRQQALSGQLKQYSVPAARGIIKAHDGDQTVPIVLNETLYTLYADPVFIKDPEKSALKLSEITKGDSHKYAKLMKTDNTRYVILSKKLTEEQRKRILALRLPGVGLQAQDYRTYPQTTLASQLLGFVNDEGKGTYGVEQSLNKELSGTPGMLRAITDASGVPLAASKNNIEVAPKNGHSVVLTIDLAMQKQLETILKEGLERAKSKSGSALVIDPNTGAIKAMANWPTYNPGQYFTYSDASIFTNSAVSSPLEVGSVMKVLTASAALDKGVIRPDTTYYDPGRWEVDGHTITNVEESGGPGTRSLADILNLSINTGATWMLIQMGGGELNQKARETWHDYMVNRFQFGKLTNVEQGYEATGYVPNPKLGDGLNIAYANTSFGQAMTATPLQMAAALSSVLNGGTYYQPRLVDATVDAGGKVSPKKPVSVRSGVVASRVSLQMQSLMEYVVTNHYLRPPFGSNYSVGGKTGTAQIANPAGGYWGDRYNGMYIGFVGGDHPQYVIAVRVNEPGIGGYAGSAAAQPIFTRLGHMLINNFGVTPRSQ